MTAFPCVWRYILYPMQVSNGCIAPNLAADLHQFIQHITLISGGQPALASTGKTQRHKKGNLISIIYLPTKGDVCRDHLDAA